MSRRPWFVALAVIVALAVGVGGWWVALRPDGAGSAGTEPDGAIGTELDAAAIAAITPTLAPFTVTLSSTPERSELDFGTRVDLRVRAMGDAPIARVELWDGDRLVGVKAASDPAGMLGLTTTFTWMAVATGDHLLMARAVEVGGRASWSRGRALTVGLSTSSVTGPAVFVPLQPGLTAAQAAAQLGVDPASVLVPSDDPATGPVSAADAPEAPVSVGVKVAPPAVPGIEASQPVPVDTPIDVIPVTLPAITLPPVSVTTTTAPVVTAPVTTPPVTTSPGVTAPPVVTNPVVTTPPVTTPVVTTTPISIPPTSSIPLTVLEVPGAYGFSSDSVVLPPVVATSVADCAVTVTISAPRESLSMVHRAQPGLPYFTQVGTIKAGETSYTLTGQMPGIATFVVSDDAYPSVESAPVKASVPAACAANSGWSGGLSIINGVLTVPEPGAGYYLYVPPPSKYYSTGTRIPTDERAFITATSTKVDISMLLPYLGLSATTVFELWQSDGAGQAQLRATATLDPPDGTYLHDIIGAPSDIRLTGWPGTTLVQMTQNGTVSFEWETDFKADRVIWQVLNAPLPRSDTDLAPPGQLAVGISESIQSENLSGDFATFSIDMEQVPRDAPPPTSDPPSAPSPGGGPPSPSGWGGPVKAAGLPEPSGSPGYAEPWTEGLLLDGNPSSTATIEEYLQDITNAAGPVVYVRALPMIGKQVVGLASPTVVVVLPPYSAMGALTITSATLDAGQVPNPNWNRCALVDVPWDQPGWQPPANASPADVAELQKVYPFDSAYCQIRPDKAEMSALEEFGAIIVGVGEMVIDGVDALATVYNNAVAYIAQVVAEWNPICKALGGAAEQTCAEVTQLIAAAAVKAALAILGLPPTLPTSAQLIASARAALEADISLLAAEWLAQMGVPCEEYKQSPSSYQNAQKVAAELGVSIENPKLGKDGKVDLCREISRAVVDKVLDEVQAAYNSSLSASLGGPAQPVPIPGLIFSPHPAATFQPMVLTVDAVPVETGLDPAFICSAEVYSGSSWHKGGTLTMVPRGDGTWRGAALLPGGTFGDLEDLWAKVYWLDEHPYPTVSASMGSSACFGESGAKGVKPTDVLEPRPGDPPGM